MKKPYKVLICLFLDDEMYQEGSIVQLYDAEGEKLTTLQIVEPVPDEPGTEPAKPKQKK